MDPTTYLPVPLSFGCKVQLEKKPFTLMPWGHFKSHNLYFIWSPGSTHESFCISRVSFLFSLEWLFQAFPNPLKLPCWVPSLTSNSMEERGAMNLLTPHLQADLCLYLSFLQTRLLQRRGPRSRPLPPLLELHFIMYTCSLLIFNFSWSTGSFHSK